MTRKPIGTYNLLVMAFLALFGILLIGFGWRDIRDGEAAGFWFFVGWLAFIGAIVMYAFKRKASTDAEDIRHREQTGGLPALLLLQDSSLVGSNGAGWEGGLTTFLAIAIPLVIVIAVVVYLRKHKRSGNPGT
jgi:hypothetical protein